MRKLVSSRVYYFILLIVSAFGISCSQNDKNHTPRQTRPVKAIQIGNTNAFNGRAFPGRARAFQQVNLSFNVSGSLIELPVKIGDNVKKGSLIAKLDPLEFEAKLQSAQAEFTRDQQNFLRAQALVGKGHISKADYDLLKAKLGVSKANQDLAEKSLKDSVLKAPFDGKISTLYVENYQTIASKQNIARLLDTSQIEMVLQMPEGVISYIPNVKDIVVHFDSFPNVAIPAQIKEISNEASPETRTYPVTLIMQQPKDVEILPGMAGKATGHIEQTKNTQNKFTIPSSAVVTTDSEKKTYVWIINPKTYQVHRCQIQIGELTPTGISVIKGLHAGEWVVTAGIHSLEEGEKVTILNEQDN
ncbi:efflux RND transporter periplasmic adaptor subunit [Legionella cherrii]|uniref:Hemolysin D n=1 Tax=Legionella cherrii TaxID=28084 RepID=A0A0W0SHD6_9GAMM|nr:efflux RND transporter periplasmic adaptor subunit [Legionella cherrii]KTC82603.1 hemolysin D [Legionella cherrii]VEB35285.1 hemolysin D [Legionella cherrii]